MGIAYYAQKHKPEAVATLTAIGEAGMQAYIYTQAGYQITVTEPKPLSPMEMVIWSAQSIMQIEQEQRNQANQLKTLADNVSIIQSKLASPSKEVLPAHGYASIKDLEIQVASEFPKTLLRALIAEHNEVRSMSCTKWIEGANTYVDYTAYCVIDSGQRVLKADGTPSTKLESPLFTQPFKHSMR